MFDRSNSTTPFEYPDAPNGTGSITCKFGGKRLHSKGHVVVNIPEKNGVSGVYLVNFNPFGKYATKIHQVSIRFNWINFSLSFGVKNSKNVFETPSLRYLAP